MRSPLKKVVARITHISSSHLWFASLHSWCQQVRLSLNEGKSVVAAASWNSIHDSSLVKDNPYLIYPSDPEEATTPCGRQQANASTSQRRPRHAPTTTRRSRNQKYQTCSCRSDHTHGFRNRTNAGSILQRKWCDATPPTIVGNRTEHTLGVRRTQSSVLIANLCLSIQRNTARPVEEMLDSDIVSRTLPRHHAQRCNDETASIELTGSLSSVTTATDASKWCSTAASRGDARWPLQPQAHSTSAWQYPPATPAATALSSCKQVVCWAWDTGLFVLHLMRARETRRDRHLHSLHDPHTQTKLHASSLSALLLRPSTPAVSGAERRSCLTLSISARHKECDNLADTSSETL